MKPVLLHAHQVPVYESICRQLDEYNRSLLAAMTGFGKTEVAVKIIQEYVAAGKRVLVLAHGQDVLRRNFSDRLNKYGVGHCRLDDGKGAHLAGAWQVVVTLPQTAYRNMAKLGEFDLIVVDEAHQLYNTNKKMYATISNAHSGRWFLMTASHYGMETATTKAFFSMEEALAIDALQDVHVRVQEIDANIQDSDYTADNELRQETRVDFKARSVANHLTPGRLPALVIAHSIEAAKDVEKKLKKVPGLKGKVARSDSKNDRDSDILKDFANPNGRCKVLVVVYRANLGFDMEHLATVVDASYTQNVVRVQQMVGRLTRRSDVEKMFVKLAPSGFEADMRLIVTAVLALGLADVYRSWDGKYQNVKIRTEDDLEIGGPHGDPGPTPPDAPKPPREEPEPPTGTPAPTPEPGPVPEPPTGGPGRPLPPTITDEPGDRTPRRLPKLHATFGDYQFFVESKGGVETTLHKALAQCRAERGGWDLRDPDAKKAEILEIIKQTGKTLDDSHSLRSSFYAYMHNDAEFKNKVLNLVNIKQAPRLSDQLKIDRTLEAYRKGNKLPAYIAPGNKMYCPAAREALINAGWHPQHHNIEKGRKSWNSGKGLPNKSKKVRASNSNRIYESATEAAKANNLKPGSVARVCRKERSHLGGLQFWYVDDEGNKIEN